MTDTKLYILIATFARLIIVAGIFWYRSTRTEMITKLYQAKSSDPIEHSLTIIHPIVSQLYEQYSKILIGQHDVFVGLMGCRLAGGHALLTGLPGTGKTLAVKTFVEIMGLDLGRVQGTSDLIPADIVGSLVYNPKTSEFDTVFGPVMHECVLVDEINRMPSKTQSALLQAMAEGNISIGQTQYHLPEHFTVFATQNPHDRVGTFPLPAAQLDRFMCEIKVEAPGLDEQSKIFASKVTVSSIPASPLTRGGGGKPKGFVKEDSHKEFVPEKLHSVFESLQSEYNNIAVPSLINTHVAQIIQDRGLSSRAGQQLIAFARAIALMQGKFEIDKGDIEVSTKYVLKHRLLK